MTIEPGAHTITWLSDGRPDMFVVVCADRAHLRWLALADVIVHPTEMTVSAAEQVAADTLCRRSGCALVAVGVLRRGSLLRFRCGRSHLCPGDGSGPETLGFALLAYRQLARGESSHGC